MSALLCDLGGTNSRLALADGGRIRAETARSLRNDDHVSFDELLRAYVASQPDARFEAACIALAAPIRPERVTLTNRDWTIERDSVAAILDAPEVHFINDFEALGFALDRVSQLRVENLLDGPVPAEWSVRAVLGAGTGFNAAALVCDPATRGVTVVAAECGHMTLPVETEEEMSLSRFLAARHGRASVERVLSGRGLTDVRDWLAEREGSPGGELSPADVVAGALSGDDPLSAAACATVLRVFGRVTGDLALAYLPRGGIYLAGGVSRGLAPLIRRDPGFRDAFLAKGRMRPLMEEFRVSLVTDDRTALWGCLAWLETRVPGALAA